MGNKLIIVTDENNEQYAELLMALISMKEDKDTSKADEPISSVIWHEKDYIQTKPQLDSNNKIVFIGNIKSALPVMKNINFKNEFSKYGIYYGNIGNKAVINVDESLLSKNNKLYDEYILSYVNYIENYGKAYDDSQKKERFITIEDFKEKRVNKTKKVLTKFIRIFRKKNKDEVKVSDKVSVVTASIVVPFFWPKDLFASKKSKSNIRDQQFRCSILMFYLNGLASFME